MSSSLAFALLKGISPIVNFQDSRPVNSTQSSIVPKQDFGRCSVELQLLSSVQVSCVVVNKFYESTDGTGLGKFSLVTRHGNGSNSFEYEFIFLK